MRTALRVLHRVLFTLLVVVLARPALAQTADDDYAVLRDRFENLFLSLQNQRGVLPNSVPVVRGVRDEFAAFATKWPDDARGPAGMLQLSMWLDDGAGVNEASERLFELRPDDDGLRVALMTYFMNRNRYGRALAIAERGPFDLDDAPRGEQIEAQCLFAEQRYQEAFDALAVYDEAFLEANLIVKPEVDRIRGDAESYLELWSEEQALRSAEAANDDLPIVEIELERGTIEVELFENEAPNTVANFISLAESGFYTNTKFHRVEPNFMAQGGDPNSREGAVGVPGQGHPGYRIKDEHTTEPYRKHFTGSLAMAKTTAPDSAGCQFYITATGTPHLNGKHTVFGRVTRGLDVARAIEIDDVIVSMRVKRKRLNDYIPETIPEPTTPPPGQTPFTPTGE